MGWLNFARDSLSVLRGRGRRSIGWLNNPSNVSSVRDGGRESILFQK